MEVWTVNTWNIWKPLNILKLLNFWKPHGDGVRGKQSRTHRIRASETRKGKLYVDVLSSLHPHTLTHPHFTLPLRSDWQQVTNGGKVPFVTKTALITTQLISEMEIDLNTAIWMHQRCQSRKMQNAKSHEMKRRRVLGMSEIGGIPNNLNFSSLLAPARSLDSLAKRKFLVRAGKTCQQSNFANTTS